MAQIHVFDTYATAQKGRIMHFDVILPDKDPARALACARDWLKSIGEEDASLTQERCCYCHSENDAPQEIQSKIAEQGYAIYPLEGCPRNPA